MMAKSKKKKIRILISSCFFFLSTTSCKLYEKEEAFTVREEFEEVLNHLPITYDYTDLIEDDISYDEWSNYYQKKQECTNKNSIYKKLTPEEVISHLYQNEIPKKLLTYDWISKMDNIYYNAFVEAYKQALENCPKEKLNAFYHNLETLSLVENNGGGLASNRNELAGYYPLYNTLEIVPKRFRSISGKNSNISLVDILLHEFNHVIENSCSCYKKSKNTNLIYNDSCFTSNTIAEALAEEETKIPAVYNVERTNFNRLKLTFLFDERYSIDEINDIFYTNDYEKLMDLFKTTTKLEKEEVYYLLSSYDLLNRRTLNRKLNYSKIKRDESIDDVKDQIEADITLSIFKLYLKNLVAYNEKHHLSLDDMIYFYKLYVHENLFSSWSNILEYDNFTLTTYNAFCLYLSNYYSIEENIIREKLELIDGMGKTNLENPIRINSKKLIESFPKDKQNFLTNFDYEKNGFYRANDIIKKWNDEKKIKTYKKEK